MIGCFAHFYADYWYSINPINVPFYRKYSRDKSVDRGRPFRLIEKWPGKSTVSTTLIREYHIVPQRDPTLKK
jgi:hypothetical protein